MKEKLKEEHIGFRVDEDEYERIEAQARLRGESVNEWCRNLALSESRKDFGMTASERILYEQVAVIRHMLGHLLKRGMAPEEFEKLKQDVEQHAGRIAASIMTRSEVKRGLEAASRG